jgi:N-acyl-D-amino-acid deacylase
VSSAPRRLAITLCVSAALLAGCASVGPSSSGPADLLITNGRILDGTGNHWTRGDIAVRDGRIIAIAAPGRLGSIRALRTIDAGDRIVAPGFIDVHAHIEMGVWGRPTADNYIHDGVTSVVTGNCGGSADSLKIFLGRVDSEGTSINIASLVGHNTVRRQVMDLVNRQATAEEQKRMEALVEQAMKDGAVGFSTGLIYSPGLFSNTPEVTGLAKASARHGGVYASHIRNEGNRVADAINEALDIGRQAGMPVQISHFKVSAPANWGRSRETLAMVEKARAEGLDVTIDQYPYTASSTSLSVMLPDWAVEGGQGEIVKRLKDETQRPKIAAEMLANARSQKRPSFAYAVVTRHSTDRSLAGKSITDINRKAGRPDTMEMEIETILDLLIAGGAQMVFHGMNEDDVKHIMGWRFNMVAADGGVQSGQGMPHPRSYGTNARVLGKYVREEKVIPLEEAVRRMTSLPAQKFQLKDRGLLREGFMADIVVFDEQTVADKSTYDNPHQFSVGFDYVIVNGKVTMEGGKHTGAKAGRSLRGPGYVKEG